VFVYMFPTLNVMGHGSYLMGRGSHIRWVNGLWVNSSDPLPALNFGSDGGGGGGVTGACGSGNGVGRKVMCVYELQSISLSNYLHPLWFGVILW